jgi:hypothetical protein
MPKRRFAELESKYNNFPLCLCHHCCLVCFQFKEPLPPLVQEIADRLQVQLDELDRLGCIFLHRLKPIKKQRLN